MTKLTAKKIARINIHTTQSNAAFARLTKPEKRVAIARDVLKSISQKSFTVVLGSYLEADNNSLIEHNVAEYRNYDDAIKHQDMSLRELLPALKKCEVCAKGALFVCTVARRNKVTIGDFSKREWNGYSLASLLGNIFSANQLDIIETEFENSPIFGDWRPIMHLDNYEEDSDRLKIIMKNIIKNKGTFKPVKCTNKKCSCAHD